MGLVSEVKTSGAVARPNEKKTHPFTPVPGDYNSFVVAIFS